jgi:hypothetical protein
VNLCGSDLSPALCPLPLLPLLVRWWEVGDGMDSSLHLVFDVTAVRRLSGPWIHGLCAGLAEMFEKIVRPHA